MIEAYISNLGKYNEGQLAYERVAFPTNTETVQAALKKIGIDGIRYEEFFISDYDGSMPQLHKHLGEYESIDELNHLAQNLDNFDFYSDVHMEEDLGRLYIQDFGTVQVPEQLIDYIDYEAYGRDARINEGGHFAPGGYVQGGHSR